MAPAEIEYALRLSSRLDREISYLSVAVSKRAACTHYPTIEEKVERWQALAAEHLGSNSEELRTLAERLRLAATGELNGGIYADLGIDLLDVQLKHFPRPQAAARHAAA